MTHAAAIDAVWEMIRETSRQIQEMAREEREGWAKLELLSREAHLMSQ
ncbi:MAG: hypothetical protein HQK87_11310, partial [Nitrospinae bacterium]|nr:hypothetical protein [Nitrospinota bacterium]